MTDYVGELLRLTVSATNFRRESLTDLDVTSMKVIIYDSVGEELVAETEMGWQAEEELWFYLWLTTVDGATSVSSGGTAIAPGSYRAKITLIDLDDHPSWEFVKVRLARNPVGD